MARIKIKDLPLDMKVSEEDLKKITGGGLVDTRNFSEMKCGAEVMSGVSLESKCAGMKLSPNLGIGQHACCGLRVTGRGRK